MNEYEKKWVEQLKKCDTLKEKAEIISHVYEEGFEDGCEACAQ